MKTYVFHINGMRCASCAVSIERVLGMVPGVAGTRASFSARSIEVTGEFGDRAAERVVRDLCAALVPYDYSLSLERRGHAVAWSDFKIAVPAALGFIAVFILLQKLGIVNLVTASEVDYGTAFAIGLVASVSTCMAVVGGLALSVSANFAKGGDAIRPQALFHVGRLVSFFALGGMVGMLGTAFQLSVAGVFALSVAVALVLIILGINLLGVFPSMQRFQPTMPSFIGRHVHGLKEVNHTLTPLLLGVATFFLPCGFTQSMQIYTLTTGGFMAGALTMSAFALGTLPVLALLSFGALGIHGKARSGIFFKTAGIVVIFFGLLNLMNALVSAGIIPPLFSF